MWLFLELQDVEHFQDKDGVRQKQMRKYCVIKLIAQI